MFKKLAIFLNYQKYKIKNTKYKIKSNNNTFLYY